MTDVIETRRLILRRLTRADVPALFAFMSDAETMRYWSTVPHASPAITETFVRETEAAVADGSADDFAMTLQGTLIGKVGLWRGNELGILLGHPYWGQGLAGEAVAAVIARAFDQGRMDITADVDPRNQGCLKMLGRLGFRKTGEAKATFLLGEEWVDSVYLSLHAADYRPPAG